MSINLSAVATCECIQDNVTHVIRAMDCSNVDGNKAKELILKAVAAEIADIKQTLKEGK